MLLQVGIQSFSYHGSVKTSSIAHWLRTILDIAGTDTSIYKTHSVRGASVSLAKNSGITTEEILEAED